MNETLKIRLMTLLLKLLGALCVVVVLIYAVKHFGTQYAQEQIDVRLNESGLSAFVHYEDIHFNPLTLTPSLEQVTLGEKSAPWLRLARVSFNHYPLFQPDLDIDFWIAESPTTELSRDSVRIMRTLGLETLLGKGHFSSTKKADQLASYLSLDIKDLGRIVWDSQIQLTKPNESINTMRTDLLASLALGQPEAMLILYGEHVAFEDVRIRYQENGMIEHLLPASEMSNYSDNDLSYLIQAASETLGLASIGSSEAQQIGETLLAFIKQPEHLTLTMKPNQAIDLKDITLLLGDKDLYQQANMQLSLD
ncbi:hypothetical protein [Marinomonas sp.]